MSRLFRHVLPGQLRDVVDLAEDECVRVPRVDEGREVREPRERLGRIHLVGAVVLDQVLGGIDPEAVDAVVVQPDAGNPVDLGGHGGVAQVEVRHALPERAVVVVAGIGLVPGIGAGDRRPTRIRV